MAGQKPTKQIGALWKHTAKSDQTGVFLSGYLELGALGEASIAVFKNKRKAKENQPDYRIVLSRTGTAGAQSDNAVAPQSAEEL